jgi:hypothetical protein
VGTLRGRHCHCVTLVRLTSSRSSMINVTSARKSQANDVLLITQCSSPYPLSLWPRKYSINLFIPSHPHPPPFLGLPDSTGPKRPSTSTLTYPMSSHLIRHNHIAPCPVNTTSYPHSGRQRAERWLSIFQRR